MRWGYGLVGEHLPSMQEANSQSPILKTKSPRHLLCTRADFKHFGESPQCGSPASIWVTGKEVEAQAVTFPL